MRWNQEGKHSILRISCWIFSRLDGYLLPACCENCYASNIKGTKIRKFSYVWWLGQVKQWLKNFNLIFKIEQIQKIQMLAKISQQFPHIIANILKVSSFCWCSHNFCKIFLALDSFSSHPDSVKFAFLLVFPMFEYRKIHLFDEARY